MPKLRAVGVGLMCLLWLPSALASTPKVKWLDFDTGLKLAAKTKKPVLVSFYADY
ncbi:MAG: thioredoxin family protein [Proteobacteria bacterium]|nr:thioredoxin family protein [Pseudomonadota bacterium]MBU1741797.1 thioredoxin family protein [Pseudomonadota bacterium]